MKRLLLVVIMCIVASGTFVLPKTSHAEAGGWLTDALTGETEANPPQFAYYGDCTQKTVAMGMYYYPGIIEKSACVYEGKDYHYVFNDGYLYVALGDSQQYYMVNNIHFSNSGFILPSPETNDYIYNAQIITDVPSALTAEPWGQSKIYQHADVFMYNFAKDELGSLNYSVQGRGVSRNGEWFVARIWGVGIVRFNTKSKAALRISPDADGLSMLTVSNDGQYVAETLGSADFQPVIYAVNGCGQGAPLLQSSWHGSTLTNPCKSRFVSEALNTALGVGYSKVPEPPEFSDDGKQLIIYSYINNQRVKVTLHGAGYEPSQLDYLAMGDSYSSGEGDMGVVSGKKYYREGTDSSTPLQEKCHISTRSYPYLLAKSHQIENSKWNTVACSGAVVKNDYYSDNSAKYYGQSDRLKTTGNELLIYQDTALRDFIPGRVRQIEFVKKYQPKVITITGTGNDVGFSGVLEKCVTVMNPNETCEYAGDMYGKYKLGREIQRQYDSVRSLVHTIKKASPSSTVYYVGYPQFLKYTNKACGLGVSLSSEEIRVFREATTYLNRVIEAGAEAEGATYVDIENSLEDHLLCDDSPYVTGYNLDCSETALNWFKGKDECRESFHPKASGHALIANAIERQHANIFMTEDCLPPQVCGGVENEHTIEIPAIFKAAFSYEGKIDVIPIQAGSAIVAQKGNPNALIRASSDYGLRPGLEGRVYLTSTPVELGDALVDENGILTIEKSIPESVEAGFHTLHFEGIDASGRAVELWWIVRIFGRDGDVDEDRIPDQNDACIFMPVLNRDENNDGVDDGCDSEVKNSARLQATDLTANYEPSIPALDVGIGETDQDSSLDSSIKLSGANRGASLIQGEDSDWKNTYKNSSHKFFGSFVLAYIIISVTLFVSLYCILKRMNGRDK